MVSYALERSVLTPCNAVELDLIIGDQERCRVDGEQVGSLHFLCTRSKTGDKPVPRNVSAIVERQKSGQGWNGGSSDNAVNEGGLAIEGDGSQGEAGQAVDGVR